MVQTARSIVEFDKECIISEECTDKKIPYRVVSGSGLDKFPYICFNGKV